MKNFEEQVLTFGIYSILTDIVSNKLDGIIYSLNKDYKTVTIMPSSRDELFERGESNQKKYCTNPIGYDSCSDICASYRCAGCNPGFCARCGYDFRRTAECTKQSLSFVPGRCICQQGKLCDADVQERFLVARGIWKGEVRLLSCRLYYGCGRDCCDGENAGIQSECPQRSRYILSQDRHAGKRGHRDQTVHLRGLE